MSAGSASAAGAQYRLGGHVCMLWRCSIAAVCTFDGYSHASGALQHNMHTRQVTCAMSHRQFAEISCSYSKKVAADYAVLNNVTHSKRLQWQFRGVSHIGSSQTACAVPAKLLHISVWCSPSEITDQPLVTGDKVRQQTEVHALTISRPGAIPARWVRRGRK